MLESKKDTIVPAGKPSREPVNNTVRLDPVNPIPFDFGSNIFTTISGKRYIPFLGDTDNLPNTFWEARLLSPTHNACITSIAKTCVGSGIYVKNMDRDKVDPDFLKWMGRVNNKQSLNDVTRLGMEAQKTDGNAWMEIVKGEAAGIKYLRIHPHTSLVCRFAEELDGNADPIAVIKSTSFAEKRNRIVSSRSLKAAVLPLYSPNPLDQSWLGDQGDLHTVMHLANVFPGILHYGLPDSAAGLRFQVLEGKAAQYNIDNFENNMVLSALLIFKNAMTPGEAAKNAREVLKAHTGQGKNGRVGVVSSENGIDDFEYKPLETQKDGSYIELDKRIEEKIITTHGWDAIFFGQGDKGALGKGSGYVRAVYDIKKTTVIDPLCIHWLENFITPLINIAAEHFGKPEWLGYEIGFQTAMPFSYSSDINVNKVITKNEGRGMLGMSENEGPEWEQPIDGNNTSTPKPTENVPPEPA